MITTLRPLVGAGVSPAHLLLALTLAACTANPCKEGGGKEVGVLTEITFGRIADDGVTSPGFDLDQQISTEGGGTGCGHGDYTAPDGTVGIDNAFARIVPALEQTEAQAVEPLILASINNGSLLLLYEYDNHDDPMDDECTTFTFLRGQGSPSVGGDGYLESSQTFDIDSSVPAVSVDGVPIEAGVSIAGPMDIDLPLTIFEKSFTFAMHDGAMRVETNEDGTIHGYMGGGVDRQDILDVAYAEDVDSRLGPIIEALLDANADLSPDNTGVCQQISVTFEFTATKAYLFEDEE